MAKIMVVDDSPDLQELFSYIIKQHGDEPLHISYANNLIEMVEINKPDVIIMDVLLKGYNGRDLCRQIKSNPITENIPIILISANTRMLDNYEECKANAIMEKPFDIYDLYEHIDTLLNRQLTSFPPSWK